MAATFFAMQSCTSWSFINISSHMKHRVKWTTSDEPTLAVHYGGHG